MYIYLHVHMYILNNNMCIDIHMHIYTFMHKITFSLVQSMQSMFQKSGTHVVISPSLDSSGFHGAGNGLFTVKDLFKVTHLPAYTNTLPDNHPYTRTRTHTHTKVWWYICRVSIICTISKYIYILLMCILSDIFTCLCVYIYTSGKCDCRQDLWWWRRRAWRPTPAWRSH